MTGLADNDATPPGPPRVSGLGACSWRWSAGIQAGIATGVPLAAFTLAGDQSLGLIASLGAFTALYGATLRRGDRLRVLPLVAIGFIGASALGVACAANAWLSIVCLIGLTALACTMVFGAGLGPPGPMQFVLVAAVSNRLAAPAHLGGSSMHAIAIPALVAVGALAAYALLAALLAMPSVGQQEGDPVGPRSPFPRPWLEGETVTIAARVVAAVAIAGLAGLALGLQRSYWMVMVAGAVLQARYDSRSNVVRALHRILGTVMGVAIFGLIRLVEPEGWYLVGIFTLLQFAIEVVAARNYALALTFITPSALMIASASATGDLGVLVGERIVDTVLGAVIAMAVLWISAPTGARRRT